MYLSSGWAVVHLAWHEAAAAATAAAAVGAAVIVVAAVWRGWLVGIHMWTREGRMVWRVGVRGSSIA